jgi:sulfur carrier protein
LKVAATVEMAGGLLTLVVNGERRKTHASTLAALLDELGYAGQKVATARNGEFVPAKLRSDMQLEPDDQIEIVAPRQGG